jgi:hypothetical protein
MSDPRLRPMDIIFNKVCVLVTAAFALTLVFGFRRDSGPGLDPKGLDRLFDAFYRGHSSVCKKLYAKAGNYEGNGCYIQVD